MTNVFNIDTKMAVTSIPIPGTNNTAINWVWFSSRTLVGIVLCEDNVTKQTKAYVGACQTRLDEVGDVIEVAQWGAKAPKAMAESLFGPLPDYAW